ncbi:uncharacterized protein JCM15063_005613 [Sporobolomyces koalae]|uniref:uncharacterized protein n=1 Tax=Sporobolomyces koalae TaxID=500713 RepID=UPI00317FE966
MSGALKNTQERSVTESSTQYAEAEREGAGRSSSAAHPAREGLSLRAQDALHHRATPYGNYKNYYTFRPASTSSSTTDSIPDPTDLDQRLRLLDSTLFRDKTVLDLGTNAGKISHDLTKHFEPRRVLGVDIDQVLVRDANRIATDQQLLARGLSFELGDFMQPGWLEQLSAREGAGTFDVVLLFSVTKWLHLHHGDEGMLRLFSSLHSFLPEGGVVVIEPQERENYARAVKKNKDLRPVFKTIEHWPPFESEMTAAGFKLEQRIERVEGGFSRPLLVWRKH